ncbi:MAG: serine hydrolase [Xanthobacter sp.]
MRSVSTSLSLLTKALGLALFVSLTLVATTEAKSSGWKSGYAAIMVDANTGRVLHAKYADSLRHPASITKVMTLYLLFEQMEAGRFSTKSKLPVSAYAARQPPSKLGVRAGSTIEVDDAIRALVTRSANDVAVVIAEAIGGSEENFARMMTRKARALGMKNTIYRNANGLPNKEQVTTARDLAILGRAIQDRFPKQYSYFATRSFYYKGKRIGNHNRLLGRVEGVDGIKTGYTNASGFNLLTSVKRDGRYLVGVVLGGRTGRSRDARMAELISEYLPRAYAGRRTTPRITENGTVLAAAPLPDPVEREIPEHKVAPLPRPEYVVLVEAAPEVTGSTGITKAGSTAPIQPMPVRTATLHRPDTTPEPAPEPVRVASAPPSAPAGLLGFLSPSGEAMGTPDNDNGFDARQAVKDSSRFVSNTPSPSQPVRAAPAQTRTASLAPAPAPVAAPAAPAPAASRRPASADSGWSIQIGAFDAESQARARLDLAQSKARSLLGNADPYTEKVIRGSAALYRARFAGLDKKSAQAACRLLKRNAFACMTLKN